MSSNEFKYVTLNDISIGKGSYGISAPAVEYSNDIYTYLRITDINDDGTLNKDGLKSVNDDNAYKYILKANDIVFARTGNSTGRSYFYDGSLGEIVYAGFLIKFSLDPQKVNPKFMKYYSLSPIYRDWVSSFSTGSTRGNINAKTYGEMKIPLPSREQQDYMVNVLSILDEKIEVNNQINKKLEEMAQAIFKRWFVDFEFPDENGNPYKSSGGKMVESEMGMIPKGWDVTKIGECCKITRGASPRPIKDFISDHGMPWLKISDASDSNTKYILTIKENIKEEGIAKSRKVTKGTLVLSNSATPGVAKIMLTEACVHDGWLIFSEYKNITREYIYCYLVRERERILALSNGSVFRNLKTDILKNYPIIIPKDTIIIKATELLISINNNIEKNVIEIKKLQEFRDILLPKLMSGEIRVALD